MVATGPSLWIRPKNCATSQPLVLFGGKRIIIRLRCTNQSRHSHLIHKSNQIFRYTRCITPKRVTSFSGPIYASLRLRATQIFSKKCRSGGEPLTTLCLIIPVRDLNLRPPAPETTALPLDQLAGSLNTY